MIMNLCFAFVYFLIDQPGLNPKTNQPLIGIVIF